MAQIVADVLTKAISTYLEERKTGTPKEISITTETMASLTGPEINVEPGINDDTINADIKLPGIKHVWSCLWVTISSASLIWHFSGSSFLT